MSISVVCFLLSSFDKADTLIIVPRTHIGRRGCRTQRPRRSRAGTDGLSIPSAPLRQLSSIGIHRPLFATVNPLPNLVPTWNMAPTMDAPSSV